MQEDIIELQSKLQFQEDTIQKLDDSLVRQGQLIDEMHRRLVQVEEDFKRLRDERNSSSSTAAERPPHY